MRVYKERKDEAMKRQIKEKNERKVHYLFALPLACQSVSVDA